MLIGRPDAADVPEPSISPNDMDFFSLFFRVWKLHRAARTQTHLFIFFAPASSGIPRRFAGVLYSRYAMVMPHAYVARGKGAFILLSYCLVMFFYELDIDQSRAPIVFRPYRSVSFLTLPGHNPDSWGDVPRLQATARSEPRGVITPPKAVLA